VIKAVIVKRDGRTVNLRCEGHAYYDDPGRDIVCAAVSVLVINTINSIEKFCHYKVKMNSKEESGLIDCSFPKPLPEGGELLIDSLCLGLSQIMNNYGDSYFKFKIQEDS
jgi:hypothetical protein